MNFRIWLCGMLLGLAAWADGGSRDSVLALVGGEVITTMDIAAETWRMERGIVTDPNLTDAQKQQRMSEMREVRLRVADMLVERELLFLEFKARGFQVPPQLIVQRTNEFIEREAGGKREDYYKKLKAMNMSPDDFKESVTKDIAIEMLMSDRVYRAADVPTREVEEQYENNKEKYLIPGRVRLQAIVVSLTSRSEAEAVKMASGFLDKLKAGADFGKLAESCTDHESYKTQGDMGWFEDTKLTKVFADNIKGLKQGEVSAPFKFDPYIIILKVNERVEPVQELTPEIRKTIFGELRNRKVEQQRLKYVNELTHRHFVQIYYSGSRIQNVKLFDKKGS
jgi:parvulin-like peptidyl-prolyl isomerase